MTDPQQPNQPAASIGLERPATVLLSYDRDNTAAVKDLQLRLELRGIHCWRDKDDLLPGEPFEQAIIRAIEHKVDAMALYVTPDSLKSEFVWKKEIPAALRRHKRDPQFYIMPILDGVTFEQLRQTCDNRNAEGLKKFDGISLTEKIAAGDWEEQNKRLNEAARDILRAALTLRLRRIKATPQYEPWLFLTTFRFKPLLANLDLALNWSDLVYEKEQLHTAQEWDHILQPALLDVKQLVSEEIRNHRLHIFAKCILPIAVALGFTFRKSTGFTLLLESERQKETWSTDTAPSEPGPLEVDWNFDDTGDARIAVVDIATSREIKRAVSEALPSLGLTPAYRIALEVPIFSDDSVKDGAHALAMAQQVGRLCQKLYDHHRVKHIHLFLVTPVELAVLIGYQFNALCPITLYEFRQDAYTPIGTIR